MHGIFGRGHDELAQECCDIRVVADNQEVFIGRAIAKHSLELGEGRGGRERIGDENACLVAGLGANELRRLKAALERAGDDQVEADLHAGQNMGQMQTVALAVLVERTLEIEQGIESFGAGAGVTEDIQVHAGSVSPSGAGFGWPGSW